MIKSTSTPSGASENPRIVRHALTGVILLTQPKENPNGDMRAMVIGRDELFVATHLKTRSHGLTVFKVGDMWTMVRPENYEDWKGAVTLQQE